MSVPGRLWEKAEECLSTLGRILLRVEQNLDYDSEEREALRALHLDVKKVLAAAPDDKEVAKDSFKKRLTEIGYSRLRDAAAAVDSALKEKKHG